MTSVHRVRNERLVEDRGTCAVEELVGELEAKGSLEAVVDPLFEGVPQGT